MSEEPSKLEAMVLMAWQGTNTENHVFSFEVTAVESGVHVSKIRRAVRALARKGYLEFHRMCWDDEGYCRGAGYAPTQKGESWLDRKPTN